MSPDCRSLLLSLNEKRATTAKVFIRITGYGAKNKVGQGCVVHDRHRILEACGCYISRQKFVD